MRTKTIQAISSLTSGLLLTLCTSYVHSNEMHTTSEREMFEVHVSAEKIAQISKMRDLAAKMNAVLLDFASWSANSKKTLTDVERKELLDSFSFKRAGMSLSELRSSYERASEEALKVELKSNSIH